MARIPFNDYPGIRATVPGPVLTPGHVENRAAAVPRPEVYVTTFTLYQYPVPEYPGYRAPGTRV
eukprot:917539-Rhodomonas_salina.4